MSQRARSSSGSDDGFEIVENSSTSTSSSLKEQLQLRQDNIANLRADLSQLHAALIIVTGEKWKAVKETELLSQQLEEQRLRSEVALELVERQRIEIRAANEKAAAAVAEAEQLRQELAEESSKGRRKNALLLANEETECALEEVERPEETLLEEPSGVDDAALDLRTVEITKLNGRIGIEFYGTLIGAIKDGSAAHQQGGLRRGDQLITINGVDVETASPDELSRLMRSDPEKVTFVVRHNPQMLKDIDDEEAENDETDEGDSERLEAAKDVKIVKKSKQIVESLPKNTTVDGGDSKRSEAETELNKTVKSKQIIKSPPQSTPKNSPKNTPMNAPKNCPIDTTVNWEDVLWLLLLLCFCCLCVILLCLLFDLC